MQDLDQEEQKSELARSMMVPSSYNTLRDNQINRLNPLQLSQADDSTEHLNKY